MHASGSRDRDRRAAPACVVSGRGTIAVDTTPVVYSEPPPPQVETVEARPGFVWVRGRWNWHERSVGLDRRSLGARARRLRVDRGSLGAPRQRVGLGRRHAGPCRARRVVDNTNAQVASSSPAARWRPVNTLQPASDTDNAQGGVVVVASASPSAAYPTAAPPPPQTRACSRAPASSGSPVAGTGATVAGTGSPVTGSASARTRCGSPVAGSSRAAARSGSRAAGRRGAPANNGPIVRDHRH